LAARYDLQLEDSSRNIPRRSWYDSHQPEDVPHTPAPWNRGQRTEAPAAPPRTRLTPMPPMTELESVPSLPAE